MKRLLTFPAAVFLTARAGAQPAVEPMDFARYQQRAGELFDPKFVTDRASDFSTAADNLLLMCQAVAAVIIVAGMISKIRKDQVQMEGIASMMLKVAFIALIPTLGVRTLETADSAAAAIGYQPVGSAGTPAPMMSSLWGLLREWAPPGSPYLDALETQSAELPASGKEEAWGLQAWNWARGVGTTTSNVFDAAWQSVSGGLRAGAVFASCGAMACASSVALMLTYVSEVLRYLLFFTGCALLPVFIAALGIDALRTQGVRFIVFLFSIACWPVGWALANAVTAIMARGLIAWMRTTSAAALTLGPGDAVLPLSIAAPYVGWGALFLFMGSTVAICLWVIATAVYAPLAVGRLVAAGATAAAPLLGMGEMRRAFHASSSGTGGAASGGRGGGGPAFGLAGRPKFSVGGEAGLRPRRLQAGASAFETMARPSPPFALGSLRTPAPPPAMPTLGAAKPRLARIAPWLPPPRQVGGN